MEERRVTLQAEMQEVSQDVEATGKYGAPRSLRNTCAGFTHNTCAGSDVVHTCSCL